MSEQDEELHLKQSYLKSEIIDKNIDQDKFLDYCMKIKENGDDINNWTFDELKKCVADFNELLKQESEKIKENENFKVNEYSSVDSFLSSTNPNSDQNFQIQSQTQQESNQQNQNRFNFQSIQNIISNKFYSITNTFTNTFNNNNNSNQN